MTADEAASESMCKPLGLTGMVSGIEYVMYWAVSVQAEETAKPAPVIKPLPLEEIRVFTEVFDRIRQDVC